MNLYNAKEEILKIQKIIISFSSETKDYSVYTVKGLIDLRKVINILEKNELYLNRVNRMKSMNWYNSFKDTMAINSSDSSQILSFVDFIKNSSEGITDFLQILKIDEHEYVLNIYLPKIYSFSDLASLSNDLKKCIELPSIDVGGNATVVSAQPGSIWLVIAFATSASISIIGKIIKIATQANVEIQKGKIFANYAKNLELNNEIQKTIMDAQKKMVDEIINKEIEEAKKDIDHKDDITKIDRLKLAVTKMAELLRRDIKFLPSPKLDLEIKSEFPENTEIDTIGEELKKLGLPNENND